MFIAPKVYYYSTHKAGMPRVFHGKYKGVRTDVIPDKYFFMEILKEDLTAFVDQQIWR